MQLTLKKDANINSLALQHGILLQSTMLLEGREGVLETEKKIYLMMSFINALVEEDLLELCNNDERNLYTIIMEDIEPFFNGLDDDYKKVYDELSYILLEHCDRVWDNQHSLVGMIDAVLTMIASMSDEDKKEALVTTGKIAEKAFEARTAVLEEKTNQVNNKLEAFVKQYQQQSQQESKEKESDAE